MHGSVCIAMYSLHSSYSALPAPQAHISILYSCPANRSIRPIFLDSMQKIILLKKKDTVIFGSLLNGEEGTESSCIFRALLPAHAQPPP